MKILLIVLVLYNLVFSCSFKTTIDSVDYATLNNELFDQPKFKRWIEYWKLKMPEVRDVVLEKTDTIGGIFSSKIDLKKWFKERELRGFTINFSPENNYLIDMYSHIGFEYNQDTIFVLGGDVDPSFVIINIKDSMLHYFTLGPYSFFDESIWISDSTCYILGFLFDDSRRDVSKAYSKILILRWNFKTNLVTKSVSQKLPFKNELMNFLNYLNYLYPYFKMGK